jgi:hypothetical protein
MLVRTCSADEAACLEGVEEMAKAHIGPCYSIRNRSPADEDC